MSRKRQFYAYDIDVQVDGGKVNPAYVTGTRRDAITITRREGRRMWRGGAGVFTSVRLLARRRSDGVVVFEWARPAPT